jgi:hypothetical protein
MSVSPCGNHFRGKALNSALKNLVNARFHNLLLSHNVYYEIYMSTPHGTPDPEQI